MFCTINTTNLLVLWNGTSQKLICLYLVSVDIHLSNHDPPWLSGLYRTCTELCRKKGTVLLSTSLVWPAVAGCSRADTFSQLSSIYLLNPVLRRWDVSSYELFIFTCWSRPRNCRFSFSSSPTNMLREALFAKITNQKAWHWLTATCYPGSMTPTWSQNNTMGFRVTMVYHMWF